MASKASAIFIEQFKNAATLPAVYNWKEDSQPQRFSKPSDYVELAESLKDRSLGFAVDILKSAGYIGSAAQEAETLEKLKKLKPGKMLKLDGVSVCWRIKSEKSAAHKILVDNKTADDIGDYFGMKFVAQDVGDVVRLRDAITAAPNMSSRKCEFTVPSAEGYRSHKSHHVIEGDAGKLSVEAMITHADFEAMNKLTHNLIDTERKLFSKQGEIADKRLSHQFAACAARLKEERTFINHATAAAAGLNDLCADGVTTEISPAPLSGWARKIVNGLTPDLKQDRDRVIGSNNNEAYCRRQFN